MPTFLVLFFKKELLPQAQAPGMRVCVPAKGKMAALSQGPPR
jgi:hypothetical protein